VTGIGAVSAAGAGREALRRVMSEGRSAVQADVVSGFPAGQAPDPVPCGDTRRMDRGAALFLAAAEEAWQDAGLVDGALDPSRCGVYEGSSLGPMAGIVEALRAQEIVGERSAPRPTDLLRFMTGAGGATLARRHQLKGSVLCVSAGSVSAMCAIGEASVHIAAGRADVMVAGGFECPLQQDIVARFRAAGVLSDPRHGEPACRPFDERRAGTVLGEGAGVLILEAADHARRRGAQPRAGVAGFGLVCEAGSMTGPAPDGSGVAAAAREALEGMPLDRLGWIKAHGTGTRPNDAAECEGLATVFGSRLPEFPLASLKPTLGHSLGASGGVEAVAALLAMEGGFIPATLGTERIDPRLPPCRVVMRPEATVAELVLLLAESFGGRCAALVLGRV
jgi:3-oxoacyl-(acyl-carrier-protein) synthase